MKEVVKNRYILNSIQSLSLDRAKMAFISGPRQVGKTTLSKLMSNAYKQKAYYNWDDSNVKKTWSKNPTELIEKFQLTTEEQILIILDEIHKNKGWKNKLKGLFDVYQKNVAFIITGSARLNVYKRGSDSLMGRYLHFRLHPFSYGELNNSFITNPSDVEKHLFVERKSNKNLNQTIIDDLFKYSGFPEPYFAKNEQIHNLWKKGRKEKIIREDLSDLSRVQLSQIDLLCELLTDKIGSPLSVQSLREDLNCGHNTASRWLGYLRELYFHFEITPYSKSIARSLKKEPKIYFYDWTDASTLGSKFENLIACHLLKTCHFFEDTGYGEFKLQYLRNKEKIEVDFIVIKNKKPWFTVEVKLNDSKLDMNYLKFQKQLNCPHIQVVFESGHFYQVNKQTWIMSANYFLSGLV